MAFAEEMLKKKNMLESKGHKVFVSEFTHQFLGVNEEDKKRLNKQNVEKHAAIKEHWDKIRVSDAILVLNFDRNGIDNYIGGNTFLEIGFAYVLGKKIYLLNPIPDIPLYSAEIIGMKPTILHGKVELI